MERNIFSPDGYFSDDLNRTVKFSPMWFMLYTRMFGIVPKRSVLTDGLLPLIINLNVLSYTTQILYSNCNVPPGSGQVNFSCQTVPFYFRFARMRIMFLIVSDGYPTLLL